MFSKYLSVFILFVLSTFSITIANAAPVVGSTYKGSASFYGGWHHGRKTASGERFNMYGLTAAHKSLPLGCTIRVTNKDNGKSVILKVNDRGPFHGNRILDVSQGAAKQLGFIKQGLAKIDIEVLSIPESKKVKNVRNSKLNARNDRQGGGSASTRTNGVDGGASASSPTVQRRFDSSIRVSSESYTGSTSSSSDSIGFLINGYEDKSDNIARLIASGYDPRVIIK